MLAYGPAERPAREDAGIYANGARLGWLIDPLEKRVYISHPDQPIEVLDDPPAVSDNPVLPGFVLPVCELW